ncbi:hypothetical protein FB451DRAFT_1372313 [Mycena latifolia]|nr:hypothetical protein FB451DRAFT_1372313 [Mycena latifolia]
MPLPPQSDELGDIWRRKWSEEVLAYHDAITSKDHLLGRTGSYQVRISPHSAPSALVAPIPNASPRCRKQIPMSCVGDTDVRTVPSNVNTASKWIGSTTDSPRTEKENGPQILGPPPGTNAGVAAANSQRALDPHTGCPRALINIPSPVVPTKSSHLGTCWAVRRRKAPSAWFPATAVASSSQMAAMAALKTALIEKPSSAPRTHSAHTASGVSQTFLVEKDRTPFPPSTSRARGDRAISVAGDRVVARLGWRRDKSAPNTITRAQVRSWSKNKPIKPLADETPSQSPGKVPLAVMSSTTRNRLNRVLRDAGLFTPHGGKTTRICDEDEELTLTPPDPSAGSHKRRRTGSIPRAEANVKRVHVDCPQLQDYLARSSIALTPAQRVVLAATDAGNVVLLAQPGAGKTLLLEAFVAAHPDAPGLFLLSRKQLMEASRERLDSAGANVWCCTPSTLADRLYPGQKAWTDDGRRAALASGSPPHCRAFAYDFILVDDYHDCTTDLYTLLLTVLRVNKPTHPVRIFVAGVPNHSLHGDSRFLAHASTLLLSPRPWETCALQRSMRLSYSTARFINKLSPAGQSDIIGSHEGLEPLVLNCEDIGRLIYHQLIPLVEEYGSCVVLAPFVRNLHATHPLIRLMDSLKERGIHVAEPVSNDKPLDADIVRGKVVFTTYSKFQGNQRDLAIVFVTPEWAQRCPDGVFVALTRGAKQLAFVKYCTMQSSHETWIAVSDLAKGVPGDVLDGLCGKHLKIEELFDARRQPADHITPPDSICTDHVAQQWEFVSDINGLMVTRALQYRREAPLGAPPLAVPKLARAVLKSLTERSHLTPRRAALANHACTWMEGHLERAMGVLDAQFPPGEVVIIEPKLEPYRPYVDGRLFVLHGIADVLASTPADKNVAELKLTAALTVEDTMQAGGYGLLVARQEGKTDLPRIILFNVRNGQKRVIRGTVEGMKTAVKELIRSKHWPRQGLTDAVFLQRCDDIKSNVEKVFSYI